VIAQEAYLSTGSHDFSEPALPLVVAKITIGEDAFVGRALLFCRAYDRHARDRGSMFLSSPMMCPPM
jgi:hypothetical protein